MITAEDIMYMRKELTEWWSIVIEQTACCQDYYTEVLFYMRKYKNNQAMRAILREKKILFTFSIKNQILKSYKYYQNYKSKDYWGLFTEKGGSLLDGRWIVPIRDYSGLITALVGWFPDNRKYITTPTLGFCREAQFFGVEDYSLYQESLKEKVDEPLYVVEGIFDTLAVKSLGLHCIGNMGLPMGNIKRAILSRYNRVIFVPDGDEAGQMVMPYNQPLQSINIKGKGKGKNTTWGCDVSHTYLELKGEKKVDLDFLVNQTDIAPYEIKKFLYNIPKEQKACMYYNE